MTKHIHVLEVVKSTAGVGQYIRWLVEGLHQQFQLTVVCVSEGGPALAAELQRWPGVRALSLEMDRYRIDPLGDTRLLRQLAHLIRQERFDLIHAHASKPGMLARLAAIGTGIPVIYRPACFAFHDQVPPVRATLIAGAERMAARWLTSKIQCVCNDERELARRYRVGNDQQFVTIHTGIDPRPFDQPVDHQQLRRSFGIPQDVPLVGVVGRLSRQKAPRDFFEAFRQVAQQHPQAHAVWIGSGELESETRAFVAQHQLTQRVHLLGERRDVPQLLQMLDLFVLPSHWEGFSLSVLEAMAARLPVIATRVMGTAEALDNGKSGILVPIGDPAALAQAINQLLSDPQQRQFYAHAGRQRIEQWFTRSRMLEQIATMYHLTARQ